MLLEAVYVTRERERVESNTPWRTVIPKSLHLSFCSQFWACKHMWAHIHMCLMCFSILRAWDSTHAVGHMRPGCLKHHVTQPALDGLEFSNRGHRRQERGGPGGRKVTAHGTAYVNGGWQTGRNHCAMSGTKNNYCARKDKAMEPKNRDMICQRHNRQGGALLCKIM